LVRRTRISYDDNAFHKVYRAIYDFATTDLSAVYFDVLKDRLYTAATKGRARRSGQTALFKVHYALTRLAAPLLAFTTEEVWAHTRKPSSAPDSVHLALLPDPEELASGLDAAKLARWERLLEVRGVVLKALEEARQAKFIGTSLEARVRLAGAQLDDYADDLPALFIVSQVDLEPSNELKVTVERAEGTKCERCWKYSVFPGPVCDSCADALKEMLG
jgi:isoleucyl-tRNA synthetase